MAYALMRPGHGSLPRDGDTPVQEQSELEVPWFGEHSLHLPGLCRILSIHLTPSVMGGRQRFCGVCFRAQVSKGRGDTEPPCQDL